MSSPSLSRKSSFASLSSGFSISTDYEIVPTNAEQLRLRLTELRPLEDLQGEWKTIASALTDVLCDLKYHLTPTAYMGVHDATYHVITGSRLGRISPQSLRYNLEAFISIYLNGLRQIADELGDEARRDDFFRERRARYLQMTQYSSCMFHFFDTSHGVQKNREPNYQIPPPVESIFLDAWSESGLPTFE
ncbi:hypothetical protein MMC10_003543 [Thelotrema lepadinum]|nr:hypothetical protein [Thelotrema lepadinum]